MSNDIWQTLVAHNGISQMLIAVGLLWALNQLSKVATFIHLHFWRPSSLGRYKLSFEGQSPWALVTGASDGIGKGLLTNNHDIGSLLIDLHQQDSQKNYVIEVSMWSSTAGTKRS